jgi:hypothetical protein
MNKSIRSENVIDWEIKWLLGDFFRDLNFEWSILKFWATEISTNCLRTGKFQIHTSFLQETHKRISFANRWILNSWDHNILCIWRLSTAIYILLRSPYKIAQKAVFLFTYINKIIRKFHVATEIGSTFFGCWSVTGQLKK